LDNQSNKVIDDFAKELALYLPAYEIKQIIKAYHYAAKAHAGQKRKSGEPYITHPLAVSRILASLRLDYECLIAALLHDVIEDTAITRNELVYEFGETVASLVSGVTKLDSVAAKTKAEAQAENFQKIAIEMARDIRVILIKLADRLHNMRTLGAMPTHKAKRIARETLALYIPIANRLGMRNMYVELEDLCFTNIYPLRAKRISAALDAVRRKNQDILLEFEWQLNKELNKRMINAKVNWHNKHLYRIYRKMREMREFGEKRDAFQKITDVNSIRIVVNSIDDCYLTLGLVHSLYKPMPGKFKDYIALAKINGYQALHTILFCAKDTFVEVQIRTNEMDDLANNGITANWLNGKQQQRDYRMQAWTNQLLELQQNADNAVEFMQSIKNDLYINAIYVFTPRGDIIDLPRGATALDFAYMVHTNIGDASVSCIINRNLAPLSQVLHSGDTVEIITATNAFPKQQWLDFVITTRAKHHIRHSLKQKQAQAIIVGEELLNRELKKFNTYLESVNTQLISKVLQVYNLKNINQLFENIGTNKILPYLAANLLCANDVDNQSIKSHLIKGAQGIDVRFADCCKPIPGDLIGGVEADNQILIVHANDCPNLINWQYQHQKYLPLEWQKDITIEFKVRLVININNKKDVLLKISNIFKQENAAIKQLLYDEIDQHMAKISAEINVNNRVHLARIIKKLRILRDVIKITRINS